MSGGLEKAPGGNNLIKAKISDSQDPRPYGIVINTYSISGVKLYTVNLARSQYFPLL